MRPEKVFEEIYDLMKFGTTITNISESSGVSTITTGNIYYLENGMLVEIQNKVYSVSNITRTGADEYTFDVTATGLTATVWQLALYYEYGRALEVGNTQSEKKEDPVNKNLRWPLMWLLTNIQKTDTELGYNADILISFIYLSDNNLKAKKRVETNFEPVLDPLVELFKTIMNNSPGSRYFYLPYGEIREYTLTDKFKYGSIEGNTNLFRDITDAIVIEVNLNFFDKTECADQYETPSGIGSMFVVN